MTTTTYQLIISHNNQTETLPLDNKQLLKIKANRNTLYKITKDGELIETIITKTVGDDLYVYLPNEEEPLLLLEEYHHYVPVTDEATLTQLNANLATATEMIQVSAAASGYLGATVFGLAALAGAAVVLPKDRNSGGVSVNHTSVTSSDTNNSSSNTDTSNSGSDTTDSSSDTTDTGSDTTGTGSDTTDTGSDTTDAGSDTTDNGSDTTDNGSGTTDNGSDTTDNGSGTTDNGSDTTDTGSDTTDTGSDTTDNGSDTTDTGSDTTDTGSDTTDTGSDTTDTGSDTTDNGSDTTDTGSDTTDTGSDTTDSGSDTTNTGSDTTDNGSDTTDTGSDTTDTGSDTTDNGSDTTNIGSDTTDNGSDTTDTGSDTTDTGSDTTNTGSDTTDNGSDTTDSGSDTTDSGSDTTDTGSDTTDTGSDTTDNGSDTTDSGSDTTDSGSDTTDNGSDTTDNGSDTTDNGSDTTDNPPDTQTPAQSAVTINPIDDGLINQAESKGNFVLSGAITLAEGGVPQSVTVTLNGEEKPAQISEDGKSWRLLVSGSELAKNQGDQTVSVKLTAQENGETITETASTNYKVSTEVKQPVITFNHIADDDIINLAESKQQAIKVSGNVTNAKAGDKVLLAIGEAVSEVEIKANGEFELLVASETLINHRSISANIITKDEVGNTASASATKNYEVDIDPPTPTITLDRITGDNIIDIMDLNKPTVTLTGSIASFDPEDMKNVVLTLCNCSSCAETRKILQAQLADDGTFTAEIGTMELGQYSKVIATVSSSDKAGNEGVEASDSQTFTNPIMNPPKPEIWLNPIAGDNFINTAESAGKIKIVGGLNNVANSSLRGSTGIKMQFIKDGVVVKEETVPFDTDQTSTLTIKPLLPNFTYELDGTEYQKYDTVKAIYNNRGTDYTASQSYIYATGTPSWNTLRLSEVTVDNLLDSQEIQSPTTMVRGTYSVNPPADMPSGVGVYVNLRLYVNGKIYTARADGANGEFAIEVATQDLIADSDKTISVRGDLFDSAGNGGGTRHSNLKYQVQDSEINKPEITIDEIATINAAYAEKNPTTRISGTAKADSDVPEANQQISLTVNNQTYKVIRNGEKWFVDVATKELVAANGKVSAEISVTDLMKNSAQNSAEQSYVVDVVPPKLTIELEQISGDNLLTATELSQAVEVKGKVSGDYQPTDKVKLQVGSQTIEVAIQDGTFSQVVSSDLLRANSKVLASVESRDAAGNVGKAETAQDYQVQAVDIQINFANVTTDNLINVTERLSDSIEVSGTLSGKDVGLAKSVLLTIGGVQYTAELKGTAFSVNVSGNELLNNPDYRIQAQVLDDSLQVQAAKAHQYEVQDRAAADIHITNVGDDALSVGQVFGAVRVSGKLNFNDSLFKQGYNSDAIKALVVTIGDKKFEAGFNREDFSFHFDVKREEYDSLVGKEVSYKFLTNNAQNLYYLSGSDTQKTVNKISRLNTGGVDDDRAIRATELAKISVEFDNNTIASHTLQPFKQQTLVSGEVSGTAKAGDTVEITLDGQTFSGTVGQNLRFNINVDNAVLDKAANQTIKATLITTDLAGNAVRVDDVAQIATTDNVKGAFVNPHDEVLVKDRKFNHSDDGYNMPYFVHLVSPTGSDKGGFLKHIPIGGYDTSKANPLEPVVIKYYFVTDADFDAGFRHPEVSRREAYKEFPEHLKKMMRDTYAEFSAISNVRFEETTNIKEAHTKSIYVNYDMRNPTSTLGGAAGIGENGGDVYMNSGTNGFGSGYVDYNYYTAFHEIYHTLSAKHTDENLSMIYNKVREYYATGEDQSSEFSIMSGKMWDYHMAHTDVISGFSIFDLAFMHYRFGINPNIRSGDDVYGFNHYASQVKDGTIYIWDGAGTDTFDASYESEGVIVNLKPGSWNYYRSQFSDAFVVKENVNISAYDYAAYFAEQDISGVSVSGNLGTSFDHKVYTKGQSFIGYGTQIENLNGSKFADVLIGNKADNNISGGAGNDKIYGAEGNDYLDGGLGADEMEGGTGNDRYVVDNAGDKVIEKENEGDADTVYSSITYTLPENVEHLYLIGSGNIEATGNNLNNTIVGNDGDNVLRGEGGNDILDGGRGNDTLIGGAGADTFRFSSVLDGSVDKIESFAVGEDKIQLDKAIFTALTDAAVRNHILYDSATGELSYDADGSGAVNAIHFANLGAGLDAMAIRYEII